MRKQWKQWQAVYPWAPESLQMVTVAMKLKDACSLEEKLWHRRQHIKNRDITYQQRSISHLVKGPSSQSYDFSNSHVCMWELHHKENWAQKNWCFWSIVLVKTLESPLDCKEIQPVNLKENQSWIFTGRTDAEVPILWPADGKNWLIRKDPDVGKDWKWEERGW